MQTRALHLTLLCAVVASPVAASACTRTSPAGSQGRTTISVKGSDTMVILGQRWAEEYMKADPTVTVQVTGGGSGTGIAALINGSVDICESSRSMTDKERAAVLAKRDLPVVETRVALDALAVYVHDQSPVHEMSIPALAKVYRGETTSWRDLGGPDHSIVLYGRENNSGTYAFFKEHVLLGDDFAPATQTLAGTSALASAVKGDLFGIGYGGIAYNAGVRALRIRTSDGAPAVAPTRQTAEDGTYPLSRPLFFYTVAGASPVMKRFIAWVTGPEGQKTITDVGYFPLPEKS